MKDVLYSLDFHTDRKDELAKAILIRKTRQFYVTNSWRRVKRTVGIVRIWRYHMRWNIKFYISMLKPPTDAELLLRTIVWEFALHIFRSVDGIDDLKIVSSHMQITEGKVLKVLSWVSSECVLDFLLTVMVVAVGIDARPCLLIRDPASFGISIK